MVQGWALRDLQGALKAARVGASRLNFAAAWDVYDAWDAWDNMISSEISYVRERLEIPG